MSSQRRLSALNKQRTDIWGQIPEFGDRVLRVIILEDGETLHNAYFDRNFRSR